MRARHQSDSDVMAELDRLAASGVSVTVSNARYIAKVAVSRLGLVHVWRERNGLPSIQREGNPTGYKSKKLQPSTDEEIQIALDAIAARGERATFALLYAEGVRGGTRRLQGECNAANGYKAASPNRDRFVPQCCMETRIRIAHHFRRTDYSGGRPSDLRPHHYVDVARRTGGFVKQVHKYHRPVRRSNCF